MIARKSLLILISTSIICLFGIIEAVLIAKFWGDFAPTALGIVAFSLSFIGLFNIVANLGFRSAHVKRVSEGKDLATCIGTFLSVKIILTSLMILIAIISIFILKIITQDGFFQSTSEPILYIFLINSIFTNMIAVPLATFTAKREIVKREFPFVIGKIISIPCIVLVATAGVNSRGIRPPFVWPNFLQPLQEFISNNPVISLAFVYLISSISTLCIAMWLFRKYPIKKPEWKMFKSYLKFAVPILIIPIIVTITSSTDKIMIGFYWSSYEIGLYAYMTAITTLITIFPHSLYIVLFPTLSEFSSNKNYDEIKEKFRLAERYNLMIIIPFIIVLIVLANPFIVIFFSDVFLQAASVLVILSVYVLIWCMHVPYWALFTGMDRPGILSKIMIIIAVLNIILNFMFIPENGLLSSCGINGAAGAALSTLLAASVGLFSLRFVTKRLIGIKIFRLFTLRQLIAGIVMGAVLYLLITFVPFFKFAYLFNFIILIVLGAITYLGMLYLLKEFRKEDLDFFLDLIRPKKMAKYIKSELKEKPKKPN